MANWRVEMHRLDELFPAPKLPAQQTSSLEPYRDEIEALLEKGLGPRAIFDRLRLEHAPFGGTYSSLKRLCRALRRAQGVKAGDVAIPVETAPGEVAQVDLMPSTKGKGLVVTGWEARMDVLVANEA